MTCEDIMSVHSPLFGEIRSLLETQPPEQQTWDAFVALIDKCPADELEGFAHEIYAYALHRVSAWPVHTRPPEHWVDAWLEGSKAHVLLLELVPGQSGDSPSQSTYYTLTWAEHTYLSHNGDGYAVGYTSYYNDAETMRRVASAQARELYSNNGSNVLHLFGEGGQLDDGEQPRVNVFLRGTCVKSFWCNPAITLTSPERTVTLDFDPMDKHSVDILEDGELLQRAYVQEEAVELCDFSYSGSQPQGHVESYDTSKLEAMIPDIGPRHALSTRFKHSIMRDNGLLQALPHISKRAIQNITGQALLGSHEIQGVMASAAPLDGYGEVGRATPLELLRKFNQTVPYEELRVWEVAFSPDRRADFEAAVRRAGEALGLYPVQPSYVSFEEEIDQWDEAPDDDFEENYYRRPWDPEISWTLGGLTMLVTKETLPVPHPLDLHHLSPELGPTEASLLLTLEEGTLRLEVFTERLVPNVMANALAAHICQALG